MKRTLLVGGLFFVAGLILYLFNGLPSLDSTQILGYSVVDHDTHMAQVRGALLVGVSFTLMACGSIVAFLSWDFSNRGTSV